MLDAESWCLHGTMEMRRECNARDNALAVPDMDWSKKDTSRVPNHEVVSRKPSSER